MKKIIALAFLSAASIMKGADFGTWTNWSIDYAANDKIELAAGMEYRTTDNASETDRWAFNGGITYSPMKLLSIEGVYEFHHRNRSGVWKNRHRYNIAAIGTIHKQDKPIRFNRDVQQSAFRRKIRHYKDALPRRNRLQNIKKRKYRPLLSV